MDDPVDGLEPRQKLSPLGGKAFVKTAQRDQVFYDCWRKVIHAAATSIGKTFTTRKVRALVSLVYKRPDAEAAQPRCLHPATLEGNDVAFDAGGGIVSNYG